MTDSENTNGSTAGTVLAARMIENCRLHGNRVKVSDSSGAELTGRQLLLRSLTLLNYLRRAVLETNERNVGVLLPPTVVGVVVNAALSLAGRVTANLNYSASAEIINACIARAEIKHVITSRRVMEKLQIELDAEVIYLEDVRDNISLWDKLSAAWHTFVVPTRTLIRKLGLDQIDLDDDLTLIFTSGSTGVPKAVVLTHRNVSTNVWAIRTIVDPTPDDVILGVLPFFHSFGYTVTLWVPLTLDVSAAYHHDPRDARTIGKLAQKRLATILLATPTFLRFYLKRCTREEFASLDTVVAGAEKLPIPLCEAFEQRFGVRPVEGYGATELSPLVSVNVPPSRSRTDEVDWKEGTVGRPVPGVLAKVVDPESMEELPVDTPGMLLISGPNVMKGYYGQGDATGRVIRDGWYVTGDIAELDADGFIRITGRLSRFSKIGGEMVPHVRVEEILQAIVSEGDEDELRAVVTSVPDERRGERLVVIHRNLNRTPAEIVQEMSQEGLPALWVPGAESFIEVDEIPVLGSGKTDLKAVADLALEKCVR